MPPHGVFAMIRDTAANDALNVQLQGENGTTASGIKRRRLGFTIVRLRSRDEENERMYEWQRHIQVIVDEIDACIKRHDDEALALSALSRRLG